MAYSPDERTTALGSYDMTVRIWNAATGECLQTLEGHSHWVMSVAYSPDRRTVASGSVDTTVRIWNAATGECLQTLQDSDPVPGVLIGTIEGRDRFDFADSAQVVGVSMDGSPNLQFSNGGAGGGAPVCSSAVAWHGNSVHFLVRRGGRVQR